MSEEDDTSSPNSSDTSKGVRDDADGWAEDVPVLLECDPADLPQNYLDGSVEFLSELETVEELAELRNLAREAARARGAKAKIT